MSVLGFARTLPCSWGLLLGALEDVKERGFNDEVKNAAAEGYFLADIFIDKEESMKKEKESAVGGWRGWRKLKLVDKVEKVQSTHPLSLFLRTVAI